MTRVQKHWKQQKYIKYISEYITLTFKSSSKGSHGDGPIWESTRKQCCQKAERNVLHQPPQYVNQGTEQSTLAGDIVWSGCGDLANSSWYLCK